MGKAVVLGMIERDGEVRVQHVRDPRRRSLDPVILANVEPGSSVYTDQHGSYSGLENVYDHRVVNHVER